MAKKKAAFITPPSVTQLAIGIDIGGTGTKFGIVDRDGNVLFSGEMSTKKHKTIDTFIDDLHEAVSEVIDKAGGTGRMKGMGVGAPKGNYYTGTIEYAPNLPWQGIIPLAKLISDKFQLPVTLTNDANAAAVGEMMYGAAKGMKDFIMITLGTGVGSGIVANGQLVLGHDGFAGELGHTIIFPGGRFHPGSGAYGSLEVYASATGVTKTAIEYLENRPDEESLLRAYDQDKINSKIVYECATKGDQIALDVYQFTGKVLGLSLANFVMFSSPEAIILFGGLTKAGDLILKPTQESMEENLIQVFKNKVKILVSHLKESDAAILGASALVWDKD